MKRHTTLILLVILYSLPISCEKDDKSDSCFSEELTTRQISNKRAIVKLTGTGTEPVYLVEEGTIDTRLIPCNFPMEFYQQDLQVTISGDVKSTQQTASSPCCAVNFVITSITR